jgi:hypothetical protein
VANSLGSRPWAISIACSIDGAELEIVTAERPVLLAATRGVGIRAIAVRRSGPPSPCVPAPFVSEVRGGGRSCTVIDSGANVGSRPSAFLSLAWYCSNVPPGSCAAGVGSNDEQALSTVGGSHVGCAKQAPLRIEPRFGQVPENVSEPQSEMAGHVLQHDPSGSKNANCLCDERPEVSDIFAPFALPGVAERLARVASGEDIDRLHAGPVHCGQVADVRDTRPLPLEDGAGRGLHLGVPGELGTEVRLDGEVQTADARAERAGAHAHPHSSR